jgi:hypothetical protein
MDKSWTGAELAGLGGMPKELVGRAFRLSGRRDSNPRPPPWQGHRARPPPFALVHSSRSEDHQRCGGHERTSANQPERRDIGSKMAGSCDARLPSKPALIATRQSYCQPTWSTLTSCHSTGPSSVMLTRTRIRPRIWRCSSGWLPGHAHSLFRFSPTCSGKDARESHGRHTSSSASHDVSWEADQRQLNRTSCSHTGDPSL